MKNKNILLTDGRKLSYCEYGDRDGYPILYCHGSQSSRYEMHYDVAFAKEQGIRIISPDRPGHGRSDFNSNGTILSLANDVNQLMNSLKIESYSVLGMSAGAPFAMGIAHAHQTRVNRLGIVSGFAPYSEKTKKELSKEINLLLSLAKSFPWILRLMLRVQHGQLKRNPEKALKNFLKIMSPPDQVVLKNKSVLEVIETMFKEAFLNGSQGVAHEISKILVQDWQVPLSEISVPTFIWHGSEDTNVPLGWAKITHAEIPNSQLKVYPEEGHLIIFKNAQEIFSALVPE